MYGTVPPDQTARQVGFDLAGGPGGGAAGFLLNIKPEELSRLEPTRLAIQQTLGGAWADAFGAGVIAIRIAGTTGWHGGNPATAALSGEAAFNALYEGAFAGWIAAREAIVAGGGDPTVVQLTFTDALDGTVDLVAPKSFTLRRSKSSPLLMRYVIELLVLQPLHGAPGAGAGGIVAAGGAAAAAPDAVAAALQNPLGFNNGAVALAAAAANIAAAAPVAGGAFGL